MKHLKFNLRTKRAKIAVGIATCSLLLVFYLLLAIQFNKKGFSGEIISNFFDVTPIEKSSKDNFKEIKNIQNNSGDLNLLFTGDIQAGDFMATLVADGNDPFKFVKEIFVKYDLVIASSEGVIAEETFGAAEDKPYTYRISPKMADLYKDASIDIVTLATNHGMDFGPEALMRELQILDEKEIVYFGAGANADEAFYPRMVTANGVKIGFVGVNDIENHITDVAENSPGLAYHYSWRTELAIKKAKELCDIVVVMPHWGYEHDLNNHEYQQQWGRQFIDWGADLVVGNHVHVRQGHEVYNGKNIYYALGNFAYTGMSWDPESIIGSMLHVKIVDKKIIDTKISTVNLLPYEGYPVPIGDQPTEF